MHGITEQFELASSKNNPLQETEREVDIKKVKEGINEELEK